MAKISFVLAESVRRDHYLATGETLEQHVSLPWPDLSAEGRAALVAAWGLPGADTTLSRDWPAPLLPATEEDWVALATAYQTWAAPRLAAAEKERAAAAARQAAQEARWAEERAAREQRDAEERAAREQREADKAAWIAAHGTPGLKDRFGAGYDCQRRYVSERAGVEHAGYVVDFDDDYSWRERSCPSDDAFAEATRVGGRVVWLTRWPTPSDPDEENPYGYLLDESDAVKEHEGVVLEGYLGRYTLIQEM